MNIPADGNELKDDEEWQEIVAADREGTLDYCRDLIGREIVDRLLADLDLDAELRHRDPKRRYVAICIGMLCRDQTDDTIDKCIRLARNDDDEEVKEVAFRLLGKLRGQTAARIAPMLRDIIVNDSEDIQTRLCAYRSLVYMSRAGSKVRIRPVYVNAIDDIDWEFVKSAGI